MIRLRSRLTFDAMTSSTGYPSTVPTIASAIPVLPEVESRMVLPGRNSPLSIPRSNMLRAARSLTDPPGLKPSSLAKIRTCGRSSPAATARTSSSGVLPISSRTSCARATGTISWLTAAGDRRDDGDVVAILYLRVELIEEADVVAVQIDVDEAAQLALVVEQALAHPRMTLLEIFDDRTNRSAVGGDFVLAGGEASKWSGYTDPDWHVVGLPPHLMLMLARHSVQPARRPRAFR